MAIPTHDGLQALLAAEYERYREHLHRITRLSLVDVLVITRQYFPDAMFINVDETDQDYSGAFVASPSDVLDANGEPLGDDDEWGWRDSAWAPLYNLDKTTTEHWKPYVIDKDEHGRVRWLDLHAIERDASILLAPFATQEHA